MDNVRSIIDNLSSDKIKEREAALVTLREVFSRDSVVRRFNADKEGNAKPMVWLTLFQALFTSVAKEKIAMQKKSTAKSGSTSATALRRLTDTARAVRWLIERTVHLLNKKVITALVAHLSQMLSTDRTPNAQLFQPVALDYAKALKCLLSFRPHLEHLEDSLWVKLVEVSFNVVLEDPINTHFGPAGSDDDGADADSDMYVDDEVLAVDSDEDPPPRGMKRKSTERSASPRKKAKPNRIISVTLEQVEFASLLPILIGSPVAPVVSKGERMEHIPQAILSRLQRFLELYPADSSLLHDYLTTLKHTLSHLSLNKKHDVECFARLSWDALVGLWGTKDKRMKEDLVIVLRQLFEFVVCPELGEADEQRPKLPRFDAVESIGRLWQVLNGEAESKWGMEALNLESLRLENKVLHERKHRHPFTANTFRSGLNFDSNQALSWCILELQSDCTAQLFKLSESMQDVLSPARPNRKDSRRSKLDSPVNSLLDTIRQGSISQTLCHRLQSLLFFIDRHWSLLHASLKQSIIDLLLQFVTHSTAEVQSWVFLNLAAVAYAEGTKVKPLTEKADRQDVLDTGVWESVWTHSVRRANAAATCRAACHTGQTILTCIYSRTARTSGNILSTAKILGEIETLTKDMDVQGPSYPYDSVCTFLSECLQIASQDARLYRMRLEDKVLTWLIDSWKVSAGRAKMMPYLIGDVLLLLETICSLSKRARPLAWQAVPDCPLVDSVIEENKVELIRNFVLYAKLPPFSPPQELAAKTSIRPSTSDDKVADIDLIDLIPPRPKERKISSFFSRTLESFVADAETIQAHARAETYRQHLDIAVTAALFEALLVSNGVNCNRTVLQNAAKVITSCMNFLTSRQWSHSETLLVAQGLEPLIYDEDAVEDDFFTEAMPLPGQGSGIRQQTLRHLLANTGADSEAHSAERLVLLQTLWQHAEMRDALTSVQASAESLLTRLLGAKSGDGHGATADGDDKDGFGPIRTSLQDSTASVREGDSGMCLQHLLKICIGLSACGPYLRSPSSKPSSGEKLLDLIMSTAQHHPTTFRLAFPIILHSVRRDIIVLSSKEIGKLFDDFGDLLLQYAFSRSEEFQRLLVGLLTTCLRPCTWDKFGETAVGGQFREFCDWMFKVLGNDKVRSWNLRDGIGQFLLAYVTAFPSKGPGTASHHAQDENMDHDGSSENAEDAGNPQLGQPTTLLLDLNMDVDMRVRFRASVMNAHLYSFIIEEDFPAIELYGYMKDTYTNDAEIYEHMMTRMLSLGNIMITSSAVRRGPYWHLLEAHPHSPMYSTHIESILTGVAERLGFSSLSVIFEAYASQIQYSMNKAKSDFSKYPSHLLGYRDITEATRAAFRPCAPLTVWECPEAYFETHCRILGMTVLQGLERSFGDVLGYGLLQHIDSHPGDDIWSVVRQKMQAVDNFEATFNENVDSTIVMILRCLGDLDFRKGGSVATVLNDVSPDSLSAFKQLNVHRTSEATTLHTPNVPFYPAETIIQCLQWVSSRSSSGFSSATTFHVAQELFNRVHETPIVNEQWRLVTAITMWLAYRVEDLEDTSVMRAVLNGATLMLSQSDLARSAQSILDYFFKRYRLSKPKEPHSLTPTLPGILLRICRTAQDYTSRKNDPLVQTGASLLAWVDKQLQLFAECSPFQSIVRKTLAAWPLAITESHPLADIYNAITMHNLTSVLEDRHITSNKFHLVQRIHQNAVEYDGAEDDYAKTYFWRLKECMPSSIHLQQEDITAFTSLLYLNRGHIATYNPERPDLNLPRLRHRRLFKVTHQDAKGKCWSNSQDAIMTGLLVMLEDSNPLFVSNAYHSLRRIFASFADDAISRSTTALPAEYQADVALLTEYRRPPLPRPPLVDVKAALKGDEYRRSIDNFSKWISVIGVLFCDTLAQIDNFYGQLNLILVSHVAFAEEIMPILVQTLLQLEQFEKEKRFGSLPYSLHDTLSEYFEYVLRSEAADPSCIRAIVDMVLHLRYFAPRSSDQLAYNKWLRIDYVLLARSAILCGAYTTALLFVEIALEDSDTSAASVEQVLFEIYAHIDEPDGFYAISTDDLQQFLVKRYHHENQWEKAFRFHGASLEAAYSSKSDRDGLTKSFHHFGFDHLAMDILRNVDQNSSETNPSLSANYRLGWRTETWDLPSQSMDSPGVPLYSSLRAIYRERDSSSVRDVVQTALSSEMDYLRSLGSENLAEIRVVSQELMSLREVLRWTDKAFQDSIASYHTQPTSCEDLLCIDSQFSFADIESIMATRLSLIRSLRRKEERQQLGRFIPTAVRNLKSIEKSCLLNLSRAARAAGQTQIALNSVIRAQQLDDRPSSEVSEEFANVLWLQKEEPLAVRYLKSLVENDDAGKDVPVDQSRKAIWLSRLGTWSAEAYIEKPSEISTKYFDRAISLVEEIKRDSAYDPSLSAIYRECAMFAEHQYHSISRSPDALRWKVYVDRKRQEIELREKDIGSQTDKNRRDRLKHEQSKARKLLTEDSELFGKHNVLRDTLLKQALEMHSRCLEASDSFDDDSVTRFCSLWFATFDDESISDTVKAGLARIPSRKLIMLAHQLTARISTSPSSTLHSSQESLQNTIIRMCQDHPFHILYQVYCLSDHNSSTSNGRRQSGRQSQASTQTERGSAASSILDRLRIDDVTGQRVRDIERLCDAYLEWAKFPISKNPQYNGKTPKQKDRTPFPIPKALKILSVKNLRVPVTTFHTPLDPTLEYADCVWIRGYKTSFETAGGINLPKISICMGADGQNYKQLFKGEGGDDMRQDAVMEQVFELVNGLLKQDRETRRRELQVRDYKVIPLASQAGILEFVGNTAPLKSWLTQRHAAYRPGDWTPSQAQGYITQVQKTSPFDHDKQVEAFVKVRENFKPVMRHYFTEKHKTPIAWFQMRLRYTRSVATTSIVGHILGLGDRHTSNILLDNASGEVVHIDLGIAFDQGKLLGVPEKVPFRMTADVVDGMGPSGTSGVFQRCAEETLRVLRNESEVILTVLEVFKHDPLHSWTASEVRVKHAQGDASVPAPPLVPSPTATTGTGGFSDILNGAQGTNAFPFLKGIGIDMTSGSADEAADRALSSVTRKLDKSLSVESTVLELLAEATDITNLATIFFGWGAHL